MKTQAYAVTSAGARLAPFAIERREPAAGDVLIEILFCGVCHSDIHMARDEWGGAVFPLVPGHEVVGTVVRVGHDVTKWKAGDTVGVGCFVDSCRKCEACRAGEESYCADAVFTYGYIAGAGDEPTYGGYSTRITVNQDFVVRIPEALPLAAAAPLLCAGITCYSPLRHFGVRRGDNVAVAGLGGLGHVGVKLAVAMGARVTVLSHSPSKETDALRLGAKAFISTHNSAVFDEHAEEFDFILDTVSAPHDYGDYLKLLQRDRTMVLVGLPDASPFEGGPLVMRRRRLAGSLIGGIRETQEMLDFCAQHGVAADVEIIRIQDINEAYERVIASDVRYRFVIDMASLKRA